MGYGRRRPYRLRGDRRRSVGKRSSRRVGNHAFHSDTCAYLYLRIGSGTRDGKHILYGIYRKIQIDPVEIDDGKFWTFSEIHENMGKGIFTPNFEQEFLRIESRLIRAIKQGTMKKIVNKDEDSVHTYVSPFGFYKSFLPHLIWTRHFTPCGLIHTELYRVPRLTDKVSDLR